MAAKDDQYAWVACIIANAQPLSAAMKGDIHRQDLKSKARMWLDLVAAAQEIHENEPPRDEVLPTMDASHHGDPYWVPPIFSYHEAKIFLDKWVVTSP
ncbi:hypothetical protein HAX54_040426 [Datura stramonium]|uniref:Uncharacterized protein n=1 Tax=Datura stramonium TaxID=4076 RepID=A0ABS8SK77_DATST|nr:hypothetical protein [Datura stramonium]